MTRRMSALLIGILFLLCIPGMAGAEIDIPSPSNYYVSDFAGVLSSSTKQTIENMAKELEEKLEHRL